MILLLLLLLPYLITLEGGRPLKGTEGTDWVTELHTRSKASDNGSIFAFDELGELANYWRGGPRVKTLQTIPTGLESLGNPSPSSGIQSKISIAFLLNPLEADVEPEGSPIQAHFQEPPQEYGVLPHHPWRPWTFRHDDDLSPVTYKPPTQERTLLPKVFPGPLPGGLATQYHENRPNPHSGAASLPYQVPIFQDHAVTEHNQPNGHFRTELSGPLPKTNGNDGIWDPKNHVHNQWKLGSNASGLNHGSSRSSSYVYTPIESPVLTSGAGSMGKLKLFRPQIVGENPGKYYKSRDADKKSQLKSMGGDVKGSLGYFGSPGGIINDTWPYVLDRIQVLGRTLTATPAYVTQSQHRIAVSAGTLSLLVWIIPPQQTETSVRTQKGTISFKLMNARMGSISNKTVIAYLKEVPFTSFIYLDNEKVHIFKGKSKAQSVLFEPSGQFKILPNEKELILNAEEVEGHTICIITTTSPDRLTTLVNSLRERINDYGRVPTDWSSICDPAEIAACTRIMAHQPRNNESLN